MDSQEEKEILDYLSQEENIIFSDTDSRKSFNSNNLLVNRNFKLLKLRFNLMHKSLKYVYSLINVDNIVQQVLDKMAQTKTVINIPVSLSAGKTINDNVFNISRDTNNVVTIKRMLSSDTWITDNYIVQIKTNNGDIVYPTIKTADNKIEIYFIDGLVYEYKVFLI